MFEAQTCNDVTSLSLDLDINGYVHSISNFSNTIFRGLTYLYDRIHREFRHIFYVGIDKGIFLLNLYGKVHSQDIDYAIHRVFHHAFESSCVAVSCTFSMHQFSREGISIHMGLVTSIELEQHSCCCKCYLGHIIFLIYRRASYINIVKVIELLKRGAIVKLFYYFIYIYNSVHFQNIFGIRKNRKF